MRVRFARLMDATDVRRRAELFRQYHEERDILVLPNPWDIGTARLLQNAGFRALATTSAGLAFALGKRDGDGSVTPDEAFRHAQDLVEATRVPISADLENGFGASPEAVAKTIVRAAEVGLAGASIEDATLGGAEPLFERTLAVERIHAAVEAVRSLDRPFVLTARAENFIRNRPDLDDVLWRLDAYARAGADVLYAPGLPDERAIRLVCTTFDKPINYVVGVRPPWFSIAELADMGIRRVTFGTSMIRFALATLLRAADGVLERGDCTFVDGLPSVADFNRLIDPPAQAFVSNR
ncbi:MAG TPA: isocitrate lyase/phosphoenolpyruvate mutase family protein [Polyangiaceae bacterium]|nr:isocitrate lyase/phosphoenolpyruvate mutase family protein [Polyangiaceae bacterium]